MDTKIRKQIHDIQEDEITGYLIYRNLVRIARNKENAEILEKMAEQEKAHYKAWKQRSGEEVKPNQTKVNQVSFLGKLLGLTFAAKLMERTERDGTEVYESLRHQFPEAEQMMKEETEHESQLIEMIDEESLHYSGSIVLGLNDALVELSGTLAGLTFALQNSQLVAVSGLITGIAAALSMAASEFLSTSAENHSHKTPGKSALYTGIAYIITVSLLILPYLLIKNLMISLAAMLVIVVLIIAAFTWYSSIINDEKFSKRFGTMAAISLGVAAISFGIGLLVRNVFGVEA